MGSAVPSIIPVALDIVGGVSRRDKSTGSAAAEAATIRQQQKTDEDRRQRALKAAMATQRARFGVAGLGAEDGSAEAVLLGMFQSSEEDAAARLERDALRIKASEQGASYSGGQNLLTTTDRVLGSGFGNIFFS